ncbi:MAG TPA: DUF6798 domain-containing protein [Bryobacteraceae bacterium]
MLRLLWLWLALLALGWFEFAIFPGHSYLHSASQVYLPMLERIDAPGYLSRDLAATHPNLSYTIYDEITLFLHRQPLIDFEKALEIQQFIFRLAGLAGIFLLAQAAGFGGATSLLVAGLVNWGATLPGPAVCTVDPEPVPLAFACGAILLAAGLLARGKVLAGALSGAVALLYEPIVAAPFWIVVLLAFILNRALRRRMKPILPILVVAVLLLANLAQLQPQIGTGEGLFARLSASVAAIQQLRTPYAWVSLWRHELWHYLALVVVGIWAAARVWQRLNRQMRWLVTGMGLAGIAAVYCSYLLVDRAHLATAAALEPSRLVVFTILFTSFLCSLAAVQALARARRWEAFAWFALVAALPLNARIFDFLRVFEKSHLLQLALCLGIAALLTWTARSKWLPFAFFAALVALRTTTHVPFTESRSTVIELAQWAEQNTWGASLFLFPDAGRDLYPGVFRARSRRAIWVDWKTGMLATSSQALAVEWLQRWQNGPSEPIDYYVYKKEHRPPGIRVTFQNSEFCVYDAHDLRYEIKQQ